MRSLFIVSIAVIAYTYLGYPLLLFIRSKLGRSAVRRGPINPSVSIVIAMYNEVGTVLEKLQNLLELDYPPQLVQIVIVSDGSTDATCDLIAKSNVPVDLIPLSAHRGKASALNHGLQKATGEIVVFMDARQSVLPTAIRSMVSYFADLHVGAVSGEMLLEAHTGGGDGYELGLYWSIEKWIRSLESQSSSVVGATGALYAARRVLIPILPTGMILDDVFIPMSIARRGYRVIFDDEAIVVDRVFPNVRTEFRRKVRTLAGNYQLLRLAPWMLTRENKLWWEFVSHKLLRLIAPFALLGAFISNWTMLDSWAGRLLFAVQVMFYLLAFIGLSPQVRSSMRASSVAFSFALLNTAAVVGLLKFLSGKNDVWAR